MFLATAFVGGLVDSSEAVVVSVVICSGLYFFFGEFSLVLGDPLAEEVVSVEEPVAPEEEGSHPDGPNSAQPPGVGLRDEVRVVKHKAIIST